MSDEQHTQAWSDLSNVYSYTFLKIVMINIYEYAEAIGILQ